MTNIPLEKVEDDVADIAAGRPTVSDVQQRNFSHPAVLVRTDDPVTVQQLPCQSGTSFNRIFPTGGEPERLLGKDPKRARDTIITDQPIYLASDPALVTTEKAGIVPANLVFTIHANEEWWCAAQGATDAIVSVWTDQWTK